MDLFDNEENVSAQAPLAARMRPKSIGELLGQEHLLRDGSPLIRLIHREKGAPPALILYGPPGCGKTSIALLLADGRRFRQLSAVAAGIKEVREEIEAARYQLSQHGVETILFIDEVHRFNKAQQDALLPAVEDKIITLVAATTENPSFSIITPLLSRSLVVRLEPLNSESGEQIVKRAIESPNGLDNKVAIEGDAQAELIRLAHGDARRLLTYLEAAAGAAVNGVITRASVASAADRTLVDFNIDLHYDIISAFIKSVRGSDVDAALHYLLRAIEGGEDLRFLARRLVILASEDIGMADSQALVLTTSAAQAVALVGAPEGHYALVHATVYCALAPKSNSLYRAMERARHDLAKGEIGEVPKNLRDGNSPFGQSGVYRYPHDYPEGVVSADYLPEPLVGRRYYEPTDHGAEGRISQTLAKIREIFGGKRMSAGGVAAIIAASALAIVAVAIAYAVIRFSKVLDEAGTAIRSVSSEAVPLLEEVTTTVELTNRQLERVDNLTRSVENIATKLTSSADSVLSKGSAAKLAGVAWGIAKASRKKKK